MLRRLPARMRSVVREFSGLYRYSFLALPSLQQMLRNRCCPLQELRAASRLVPAVVGRLRYAGRAASRSWPLRSTESRRLRASSAAIWPFIA